MVSHVDTASTMTATFVESGRVCVPRGCAHRVDEQKSRALLGLRQAVDATNPARLALRLQTVVATAHAVPSRVKRTQTLSSISEGRASDGRRAVVRRLPSTKELFEKVRPGLVATGVPVSLPANRRWRVGLYIVYAAVARALLVLAT
ncbi:hypothetical protein SPRG_17467, partial [Saprolegnia parasitica CBS 223.65]